MPAPRGTPSSTTACTFCPPLKSRRILTGRRVAQGGLQGALGACPRTEGSLRWKNGLQHFNDGTRRAMQAPLHLDTIQTSCQTGQRGSGQRGVWRGSAGKGSNHQSSSIVPADTAGRNICELKSQTISHRLSAATISHLSSFSSSAGISTYDIDSDMSQGLRGHDRGGGWLLHQCHRTGIILSLTWESRKCYVHKI